ncbi:MAG: sugar phosphate nucleotidyltransferase [Dehalococcoidia bacterium]|nr:sugar phosphate nucleotidyltransferase [Dehalococcoidia bacterium]
MEALVKVVLFCGGYGTRMREYSDRVPKPLVPIGSRPIIWHIMKYYAHFGHKEFILCLGYQGEVIKRYFLDYEETLSNDFVMTNGGADVQLLDRDISDWKITFIDTGLQSNVGERLWRVRHLLQDDEMFIANYSDGLTDAYLPDLEERVRHSDAVGGFLAVRPPYSFHAVDTELDGTVRSVHDITRTDLRINGGYFVFTPELFDYMREGEELVVEPFQRLIDAGRLTSIPYDGFWMSMDTFKEKQHLDDMYARGVRPWQVWNARQDVVLAAEGGRPFSA